MYEMFMWVPGSKDFKGETQDKNYAKENAFELDSWEWGQESEIDISLLPAGTRGQSRARFKEIVISKKLDNSSADFQKALCTGRHIDDVIIALRYAGASSKGEFLRLEFKLVMVTDLELSASLGQDQIFETITLQCGAYKMTYSKQNKDGKMSKGSDAAWSIVKNKAIFSVR